MIKMAADLAKGDRVTLKGERGERDAVVQGIAHMTKRDLLPPDLAKWGSHDPVVAVYLYLAVAIPVPDLPQWRTNFWTVWADPDELIAILD